MTANPPVAVFDSHLPPGLAAIRSLGRAGVKVTSYSHSRTAMGRYSRFSDSFVECPDPENTDVFVQWLSEEIRSGRIGLIAPTSDPLMFQTASALALLSDAPDVGHPNVEGLLECLLKQRFAGALNRVGFPTPATAAPTSFEDALAFVRSTGYPVVAKPRTHVGVGIDRGTVITNDVQLGEVFRAYTIGEGHETALGHDSDLAWPLLQTFVDAPDLEVISISGCIGRDGELLASSHSMKQRLWPPTLGVGTLFSATEDYPFTKHALEAVSSILGSGIFEFEVLFDRSSGEYWGIDLNPRMFGQMALDIARGKDLPKLWYESVTGLSLGDSAAESVAPTRWQMGLPLFTDLLVTSVQGPNRSQTLPQLRHVFGHSAVGAVADWRDPLPAVVFNKIFLRHPGALVKPFLAGNNS